MNSKVNDQFEKADDTDEDQDDFNFSADEELNVSLDKRIEYVLSEETFSTTTEAKSFMKKKNYRYRGLRDGRKNGHKMLFTCSRFDKCPKNRIYRSCSYWQNKWKRWFRDKNIKSQESSFDRRRLHESKSLHNQHIETQVDQEEHVLSDTEDEEDRVAKKQTKKKKASKRQVPDEVEPDFDIFSEEARRKSARISAI